MDVRLLVLEGQQIGKRIRLPAAPFIIGRDEKCHLRPASPDVSRFHCAIAQMGNWLFVRDLGSENGTYINDLKLSGTARVLFGDRLKVGPLSFQLLEGPQKPRKVEDSGPIWLVRQPDPTETAALDPSLDTVNLEQGDQSSYAPHAEVEGGPQDVSVVAGEFLREYLNRRYGLELA